MEEPDEEALIRSRSGHAGILVQYDIVHSPSYQVPVLYVQINDTGSQAVRLPSVDEAYEMLVPQSRRAQIKAVGVMGGLSMTDHPMTGLPVYFVHPCRTAEAMDGMVNDTKVKPVEFLLLWLGLIGASVGLEVPVDVAQAVATETEALPSHQ
jgi:ubiquitin-like-conjugating enzyme ATG10